MVAVIEKQHTQGEKKVIIFLHKANNRKRTNVGARSDHVMNTKLQQLYLRSNSRTFVFELAAHALSERDERLDRFVIDVTVPCVLAFPCPANHVRRLFPLPRVMCAVKDRAHTLIQFPATYSLLPLAISSCDEVGSDAHGSIKELDSDESRDLAEGTGRARLRRRFSFVLQQATSFRTRHHLYR